MLYQNEGTTEFKNLFAGTEVSPLTAGVTLASGQGMHSRSTDLWGNRK